MTISFIHNVPNSEIKFAAEETLKTVCYMIEHMDVTEIFFTETSGYEELIYSHVKHNYPRVALTFIEKDYKMLHLNHKTLLQLNLEKKLSAIDKSFFVITYIDTVDEKTFFLTKHAHDQNKNTIHLAAEILL